MAVLKATVEMSLYRDQAVVLRTWKLGEADRIISLHTHDHGKVRAVAKGIRRTKSKFGARLEPLSHVSVQLYRGRGDLDTITGVEVLAKFTSLRSDPQRFARAQALLEAVEGVAQEREPDRRLHVMLVKALATLDRHPSDLVVAAFFLKLLAHEGLQPQVDACINCGNHEDFAAFDFDDGGVLCQKCRRGHPVSNEVVDLMRQILNGGLAGLLTDEPTSAVVELRSLVTALLEHHLERHLRAIVVLGQT